MHSLTLSSADLLALWPVASLALRHSHDGRALASLAPRHDFNLLDLGQRRHLSRRRYRYFARVNRRDKLRRRALLDLRCAFHTWNAHAQHFGGFALRG